MSENKMKTQDKVTKTASSIMPVWATKMIAGLAFLAIVIFTMNQLIEIKGKAIAMEAIAEYEQSTKRAKVVTIDQSDLFMRLSSETDDQTRVLKAINMLTKMMQQDGYLVVDSASVMMTDEDFVVRPFTLTEIESMADRRGIDVDEETKAMIADAEAQAEAQLRALETQVRSYQRSN